MGDATRPDVVLSDEVFRLIFDASPVGVGLADEYGHFLAVNPSLCRLFGRPAEELLGRSSLSWTHPDDRADHSNAGTLVDTADDGIARVEKRFVRPNGEIRWAWLTFSHTAGPQGQTWTLAHMQDVTERIAAEDKLRESEAELRAVAGVVRQMAVGDDIRPDIVRAAAKLANADLAVLLEPGSPDTLTVTASTAAPMVARGVSLREPAIATAWGGADPVHLDPEELVESAVFGEIDGAETLAGLLVPIRLHGAVVGVLAVGWRDRRHPADQDPTGVISLLAGQTAVALHQAGLLRELEILATTDELSGLPNRRAWTARLPTLMDAATQTRRHLVVAVADLDNFKAFNDANGHPVGDRLIQTFAGDAQLALPDGGLIVRWGGEEFALTFPLDAEDDPLPVLERIRRTVPTGQTCSIGYAVWDGDETGDAVMERADRALYRAKLDGRDRSTRAD